LEPQISLYQSDDGQTRLEVRLERDTVWLNQEQMGELFGRERSVITKHLRNIFAEGELDADSVCANYAHTAADGKNYQVKHYNLDVIISVGYRVKSVQGTRFRQWATNTLRQHLVQGYTLDKARFERNAAELEQALALLAQPKAAGRGRGAAKEPLRTFDPSPVTEEVIKLMEGRYGPYLSDGQTNASLPKGVTVEEVTFDQAVSLLAERAAKAPPKKKKAAKKKATAKKATTKKATAKKATAKKGTTKKTTKKATAEAAPKKPKKPKNTDKW